MSIPKDGKETYIQAYSHGTLAKQWEVSLSTLDTYAQDQGWDREHKLYWQDRALEVLKKAMEEENVSAVKELLRVTGHTRPVGRPSKQEVDRHRAIEARIAAEYDADVARMDTKNGFSVVK